MQTHFHELKPYARETSETVAGHAGLPHQPLASYPDLRENQQPSGLGISVITTNPVTSRFRWHPSATLFSTPLTEPPFSTTSLAAPHHLVLPQCLLTFLYDLSISLLIILFTEERMDSSITQIICVLASFCQFNTA